MMKRKTKNSLVGKLISTLKNGIWVRILIFLMSVVFISSFLVFIIERNSNSGFKNILDAFWWSIVTVSTVGYGDRLPNTILGRVVAVFTIFVGMGTMGIITGRIASFLMERQMKSEQGLLDYSKLSGHFIICGWKREMDKMLEEILDGNPEFDISKVVLLNKASVDEMNQIRSKSEFQDIKFVSGDFVEERDLVRAGVVRASKVLVLADFLMSGDMQQIDSQTVMTVMTVKNLNKKAYVCAEILDTKFEKYLKISHCDEILLSREFSRAMLSSASSGNGISHVVKTLLSGDSGHELITEDINDDLIGEPVGKLKEFYCSNNEKIFIGLLENVGNITERKRVALKEAQKNPDISELIPSLRDVKVLEANKPVVNPEDNYLLKKFTKAIVVAKN